MDCPVNRASSYRKQQHQLFVGGATRRKFCDRQTGPEWQDATAGTKLDHLASELAGHV
jgi:hypothetical protein